MLIKLIALAIACVPGLLIAGLPLYFPAIARTANAPSAYALRVTYGGDYYITDTGLSADDCEALRSATLAATQPTCIPSP